VRTVDKLGEVKTWSPGWGGAGGWSKVGRITTKEELVNEASEICAMSERMNERGASE